MNLPTLRALELMRPVMPNIFHIGDSSKNMHDSFPVVKTDKRLPANPIFAAMVRDARGFMRAWIAAKADVQSKQFIPRAPHQIDQVFAPRFTGKAWDGTGLL